MQRTGHKTCSVFERYTVSDGDLPTAAAARSRNAVITKDHTSPASSRSEDPIRQIS
jgi:hypothetical protein